MTLGARAKRHLSQTRSPVVLRSELRKLGYSSSSLSAALRTLIDQGVLVRIGTGIYAKAKPSVLSGRPIPVEPLEVLAPIALRKLGVKVQPARRYRDYNAGRTTQVPVGVVVNVGRQRVTRKIGFNGKFVEYERD
ncbi:DUF6088 family protein [Hydrogenophaga crocea]|uniref:S-adenosylhomocysteine hydrolase n=1 Tax=Hydrogenophaga crocea TaxID=2716225 RepID=A0A6G8IIN2_9BURK|nr:DUF6088 family protein [Hydrogenophaga crocea]QIM52830.1 S-adenosylhomocysteine hydrolase [Hydrogenophaga crocea]